MYPPNLIFLIYGFPSLVCYAFVLYAMSRLGSTLAPSFRGIFFVTACVNLATYLNTWITTRLRYEPAFFFYTMNGSMVWVWNLQQIGLSHFYLAQNLCVLLLTVDRAIAIFSITAEGEIKRVWSRFYWVVVIAAHCAIAGLSAYTRISVLKRHALSPANYANIALNRLVQAIFGASVLVVCSVMNIASLFQLYSLRINRNTKSSPLSILMHEYSLFLISIAVFLAQSLTFVFVVIMNLSDFHPDQLHTHSILIQLSSDVFSLAPAIYTLFARGPIRAQVSLLFKKNTGSPTDALDEIT